MSGRAAKAGRRAGGGGGGRAADAPVRFGWLGRVWVHDIQPYLSGMDAASFVLPIVASAALLLSRYHGGLGTYRRLFGNTFADHTFGPMYDHLYWFVASVVFYGIVPLLAVLALPGERLRDYGVGLGDWRTGLKVSAIFYAVMVPLVLLVSQTSTFGGTYPLERAALTSWAHFWIYEPGYWLYFVAWEWLFRGFLLFGLYRRIGNHAIWVQLIPFVLMHAGKPEAEAFGSIIAGIALAVLALRTRSFWWGALLHAGVAGTMDMVNAIQRIP